MKNRTVIRKDEFPNDFKPIPVCLNKSILINEIVTTKIFLILFLSDMV
jgi:hypothetical protein